MSVAGARNSTAEPKARRRPPSPNPEIREQQLISLAMDVAEEQLIKRTASSQVITHFLKLATSRNELEKKKIEKEIMQLEAKTKSMETESRLEALYTGARDAMRSYGSSINHDDEEE